MRPLIFITGIGTGIGKTLTSGLICKAWEADYWKPIQSGKIKDSDSVAQFLTPNSSWKIYPEAHHLKAPLSPHWAAQLENISISKEDLTVPEAGSSRPLIVEGAGGWRVPFNTTDTWDSLLKFWKNQGHALRILVVTRDYLGSINHTLLTLDTLHNDGWTVDGLVLNGKPFAGVRHALEKFSIIPILATIPQLGFFKKKALETVCQTLKQNRIDLGTATQTSPSPEKTTVPTSDLQTSLTERDSKTIWHPFTQMQAGETPIAIASAQGATLVAENGQTYIDAISSWWVNLHGHGHPDIAHAIARQAQILEHVIFAGFTHGPAVCLAEDLLKILPGNQNRIFYSDNGSTAVEAALKLAFQYWSNGDTPRHRLVALEGSYHGDTFGAMSASARSLFNRPFESHLFDVSFVLTARDLEREIKDGQVAAFIYEPLIQGANGMTMMEPHILEELLSLAQAQSVLLIADEVMTGFGRTGPLFASSLMKTQPDLICLSKGITGGFLPLGVTSCTQKIFEAFLGAPDKNFFHGHSYTANPLACAAAMASLKLTTAAECTEKRQWIHNQHKAFLTQLSPFQSVQNQRICGTVLAFDVQTHRPSAHGSGYLNPLSGAIRRAALQRGVLIRPIGNTVYLLPPYCITEGELQKVYGVIIEILRLIETEKLYPGK